MLPYEQDQFSKSCSLASSDKKMASEEMPNADFVASTTTRIQLGRYDSRSTFSLMLQVNEFHQREPYAFFQFIVRYVEGDTLVTRMASRRLSIARNAGEFLDSVDEDAVAVILGKEAVYRSMYGREVVTNTEPPPAAAGEFLKSLATDSQRDLDTTIQRISGGYRLLRLEQGNRG